MAQMPHTKVVVVYVGDTGGLSFLFKKEDGRTVRDLTGNGARVAFWHPGAAPHAVRQAVVDGTNGRVKIERDGGEFDAEGRVYAQATVMAPEGVAGTGRGFFKTSFPPVAFDVKRRPT